MGKQSRYVAVFYAAGFEESEGIIPVDLMRRADIKVRTVSITKSRKVVSSHGIPVLTDLTWDEFAKKANRYNGMVIPGGLDGTANLRAFKPLKKVLKKHFDAGKVTAAICAGPMVLGKAGILQDRNYVCFPGCERDKFGGTYRSEVAVVVDGNVITGRAMGAAVEFSRAIIGILAPEGLSKVDDGIQYEYCNPGFVM